MKSLMKYVWSLVPHCVKEKACTVLRCRVWQIIRPHGGWWWTGLQS